MLKVFFILFAIVVVYAIMVTVFFFYRNPLPFPDRGHRCFAVPNEKAAKAVVEILGKIGSLHEKFTFDVGSFGHTVMADNATVIIWDKNQELLKNGFSIVSDDPKRDASKVIDMLNKEGFTGVIKNILPEMGDKFVFIESNVLNNSLLILRRHVLVLGKPPNQRKISK